MENIFSSTTFFAISLRESTESDDSFPIVAIIIKLRILRDYICLKESYFEHLSSLNNCQLPVCMCVCVSEEGKFSIVLMMVKY